MRKLDRNRPRDGLTNPVISDCQMIHNFHKCILMKTSVFPPARTVVCSQHDSVFPDCFLGMANTRSRRFSATASATNPSGQPPAPTRAHPRDPAPRQLRVVAPVRINAAKRWATRGIPGRSGGGLPSGRLIPALTVWPNRSPQRRHPGTRKSRGPPLSVLCPCRLTRRHNTLSCNGLQSASELIQTVFTRSHFRLQPRL
jgi:hypothetical protein